MNIHKMISELQAEKQRLDEAIGALERLAANNRNKRRSKPSKSSEAPAAVPSTDADVSHSRPH